MTQKIDYTKILNDIGCWFGDVAIIDGKEWWCCEITERSRSRSYVLFARPNFYLYSDNSEFKPTAIWRRLSHDSLCNISGGGATAFTDWECIWHESELPKSKRTITIEVDEGAEVLVNGKKVEV